MVILRLPSDHCRSCVRSAWPEVSILEAKTNSPTLSALKKDIKKAALYRAGSIGEQHNSGNISTSCCSMPGDIGSLLSWCFTTDIAQASRAFHILKSQHGSGRPEDIASNIVATNFLSNCVGYQARVLHLEAVVLHHPLGQGPPQPCISSA